MSWLTRACRALTFALSAALLAALSAAPLKQGRARPPLSLFPTRVVWSLSLNNQLIAPPAYDAARAYFPIEGPRLAAYGLDSGTLEVDLVPTILDLVKAPIPGNLRGRSLTPSLRVAGTAIGNNQP